ncbi:branched-chain amino acid ABC transporter ATP-binding protein/permease [Nocardioides jensenii]|uniref:branched-chain amino acid ABC transporter ATP-binding protein/permease n=1 Tax=Nocardioides jensenii TaxID=1843 RepID=UPI001FE0D9DB|nr:branched-chain amino acid ABC transporter ATP-binding protein/permease [Nocardioides jensenii]
MPFLVLFLALMLLPRRYLADRSRSLPLVTSGWTAPWRFQLLLGAGALTLLLSVPTFAGVHLTDWTTGVGTVIIFLSLGLLVRTSGQVSLGHVAFAAIGVTAFAHLSDLGLPWLLALLGAGLVAVPVGALLALPAMRLSGLFLAIATFGFGIALSYVFYTQPFMFGESGAGLRVPRPTSGWLATDTGYYYVAVLAMLLCSAAVVALTRSRLGRLLRALADSPMALTSVGNPVNLTRLLVFCISAFMAAIGGAMVGAGQGFVSATSYPPLLSLTYLVLVVIVGGGAPWYALVAGLSLVVIPSYFSGYETGYWLQVLFGVSALVYALTPADRRGLPPRVREGINRVFGGDRSASVPPRPSAAEVTTRSPAAGGQLSTQGITVRYDGHVAVNQATLTAHPGRVTGLIGPNGAGKTSLFNACSGITVPSEGKVLLSGRDVSSRGQARRAQSGLGRTFQRAEVFESMTVYDNVAMGFEGSRAGRSFFSQVVCRPEDQRNMRAATWDALDACGITHLASVRAEKLSTGQRRMVELARCLAGPFSVLLLDEASSGLDAAETEAFGDVIERAVRERDLGILLVEHDMDLVMRLSDYIYVLDFGNLIFEGTPDQVRASTVVRDAYLGDGESVEDGDMEEVVR